ncbi:metal-dependent hydrolase [Advenella sp. S44]|uniref:branched-chain amino acid ABC transporter ATP-binding protein/permease n=1 Tax=Advenella sp. S44 TaxID=1982755 RepID=UPI000C2B1D7B|nr:branched-chain amino acid ABC transporter ATP-binding protein/permease [Advenella sp. S44]PJX26221.1 metal-dependent hydrolase [Advenella sp. S44]
MKKWPVLVFILLLALLPIVPGVPEFWINQLNAIGIASLVVIGLVVLTGVGGLTSFGQATFVGIGAYATAWLTATMGGSPWLGLVLGIVLTLLLAFVLAQVTLRLSGHYLSLATIAVCLIFYYLYGNMPFLGRHDGIPGIPPISLFGYRLLQAQSIYYLIWLMVLLAAWTAINLLDSRSGRAIRAIKNGEKMAASFGIYTFHYKVIAFVYAAVLAGLAGWLYAHEQRAVSPSTFGINYGIEYLFMMVVGSVSSVWGGIFGAAVILTLKDQIQDIAPRLFDTSTNFELIVFGVLVVLVLHHAREGLWPIVTRFFSGAADKRKATAAPAAQWWSHADLLEKNGKPGHGGASNGGPGHASPGHDGAHKDPKSNGAADNSAPLLKVEAARKEFGGLVAVNDISFCVDAGQIVGLIGPNGAGKSTTFNLITGVMPLTNGSIAFRGKPLKSASAQQIARLGIARTFQHTQLLPQMSVLENVALGAHLRCSAGAIRSILRLDRHDEAALLREAATQLERVGLGDCLFELAGNLSLGKQRIVEVARALALDPTLLLLDEPAAGLRYMEKRELAAVLSALRDEGMSILLVEHDMDFVMKLTNHLVVMDFGTKIAEGTPSQIQQNDKVLQAYLGGIDDAAIADEINDDTADNIGVRA